MAQYNPTTMYQQNPMGFYPASYYSHLPPSHDYIPKRIFVGGLPPETSERELHDFFNKIVPVVECKVVRNTDGVGKNYGFVTLETDEDTELVKSLKPEHLIFKGKVINVGPAMKKVPRFSAEYAVATPNGLVPPPSYFPYVSVGAAPPVFVYPSQYGTPLMYSPVPVMTSPNEDYSSYGTVDAAAVSPLNSSVMENNNNMYSVPIAVPVNSSSPYAVYNAYYHYVQQSVHKPHQSPTFEQPTSIQPTNANERLTPMNKLSYAKTVSLNLPGSGTEDKSSAQSRQTRLLSCSSSTSVMEIPTTPNSRRGQLSPVNVINDTRSTIHISRRVYVERNCTTPQKSAKKSISSEAPTPVKLENRKKGPDGRFKTLDNGSRHYKFIRTPPSVTKSLPPDRPRNSAKAVQSLTKKFASLCNGFEDGSMTEIDDFKVEILSAPSSPMRTMDGRFNNRKE